MLDSTVCLVDSHNYIFRAFYGLPAMYSPDGLPTSATFGFARTLLRLLRERHPQYVAALFEGRDTFRKEIYAEYKANRDEPPDELKPQFSYARQIAQALGFPCLEAEGFEADDTIGTLARRFYEAGHRVIIVSGDKDLAQLVTDRITLFDIAKNRELNTAGVEETFGVRPAQIPDLLSLVGDSVDNIPGLPGVGPKTAVAVLKSLDTVDAVLDDPSRLETLSVRGRKALRDKVEAATDQLRMARDLATIRCDVPLEVDVDALLYRGAVRAEIDPLFEDLGFGARIRDEIPLWSDGSPGPAATPAPAKPKRQPRAETGRLPL